MSLPKTHQEVLPLCNRLDGYWEREIPRRVERSAEIRSTLLLFQIRHAVFRVILSYHSFKTRQVKPSSW